MKKLQSGRSMVEMLGVLAIIGVLSVGGVVGYAVSVQRIRINNILDIATKFSSKGVGGRTFTSLKSAGLEKPEGIDMSLNRDGIVCVMNFPNDDRFFSAFKAQATNYTVTCPSDPKCNICLYFSKPIQ